MQQRGFVIARQHVFCACLVLAVGALAPHCSQAEAQEHPHQTGGVCRGFVVLPTGVAVLSGMPATAASGGARVPHDMGHVGGGMKPDTRHSPMAPREQASSAPPQLLGYFHGQAIVPQADMLCVPIGDAGTVTWAAVSPDPALTVTAESLTGALTRSSRTNTAFALTVRRDGAPVDAAHVRLLARMPHHDRGMPGGHGPANDPDVQGLVAQPGGQGRYTVQPVDLTMSGPWLFEIHVQEGAETRNAYFAAHVGEE